MAVLSQDELKEAVKEWCEKRNIPSTNDIRFSASPMGNSNVEYTSINVRATVGGIEMPPKNGPYR